jgi:CHAD domain-containing protein
MDQLKEYTGKQFQIARDALSEFTVGADAEILHRLRVSLKKIKAVLQVLSVQHPKKIKQIRKQLQVIFHASGSVREAQIRQNWLITKQYHRLKAAAALEQKIAEEELVLFQETENYQQTLTAIEREIDPLLHKMNAATLRDDALSKKDLLEQQLTAATTEEWHDLRKLIKQLIYAQNWLTEKDRLKVLTVLFYHTLDHLQEQIGTWHDLIDMQQWLLDEQFFLSQDPAVKQQSTKAAVQLQKHTILQEQAVLQLLSAINKPSKRK